MRLFIGIPLPEGTKREIGQIVNQFKKFNFPVKWEPEQKWHVTLKFLGEVEDSKIANYQIIQLRIANCLKNCGEFFLKPEKVGYFYKRHLVVWVSVTGQVEVLNKLHQKLEENLVSIGFPKEERELKDHITVGRGKKLSGQQLTEFKKLLVDLTLPKFSEFKVKQINLYQSILKPEGSRYSIISEFKFS